MESHQRVWSTVSLWVGSSGGSGGPGKGEGAPPRQGWAVSPYFSPRQSCDLRVPQQLADRSPVSSEGAPWLCPPSLPAKPCIRPSLFGREVTFLPKLGFWPVPDFSLGTKGRWSCVLLCHWDAGISSSSLAAPHPVSSSQPCS